MGTQHRNVSLAVTVAAGALLLWAILLFVFRWPMSSAVPMLVNAVALAVVWAIAPAIWFAVERRLWPNEPATPAYARNFWIGAATLVVVLAARSLVESSTQYRILWPVVAELSRSLAWPLVVIIALVALRKAIGSFVDTLGARATKVGAFNISIELATAADAGRWSGPSLDSFKGQSAALTQDSSASLFRAIADTTDADYAVVDLGTGHEWLTSRLFIVASIIPRVRGLKRIVFLEGVDQQFLGIASTDAVRWAIARKWPWLEEAYLNTQLSIAPNPRNPATQHVIHGPDVRSVNGPLDPESANSIVRDFLYTIQRYQNELPPPFDPEWVLFTSSAERASWLDAAQVRELLGRGLETASIKRDPSVDMQTATKTLLRHDAPFVPVIDVNGRFLRLIDRCDAMTQVVRAEL